MNRRDLFLPLALLLGLTGMGPVLAQQPEPPAPPKMRFLFLDEQPGAYFVVTGGALHKISSSPYVISSPLSPSDFKALPVFKELRNPATGETKPVIIAKVSPPENTGSAVVIITPRPWSSPEAPPVYATEIISTDTSRFPVGSIAVINRSTSPMAAQFGNQRVAVSPGQTSFVQPTTDSKNRFFCKIAAPTETGWQLISNKIGVIRPNQRIIGFFVYSPSGMKHTYDDGELAMLGPPKPGNFWLTFSDQP